jgi:hypothetical protein
MSQAGPNCKAFLKATRKVVGAKDDEVIDKRFAETLSGYLAPNDQYYSGHCAYCAEVTYLMDIYSDDDTNHAED